MTRSKSRSKWMLAVAVAALLVTACRDRERSVTGSAGMNVISGRVTMGAGSTSASPAGVVVTVRGTGQRMVLGDDGRFTFAGVPDDAELVFDREADGIHATYAAGAAAGSTLAIELGTSSASRGRGRAAGSAGVEVEGVVKSAAAAQLVVTTERGDVTLAVTADTVIKKGDVRIAATDLKAGDRVHARAEKRNDVLVALLVYVESEDQFETLQVKGVVKAISATSLTVTTSGGDVTLQVTPSTLMPVAAKVGDRVEVRALKQGSVLVALVVVVDNEQQKEVVELKGTVKALSAASLTIATTSGDVVVQLASTTIKPAGLKVGDKVEVRALKQGTTLTALVIYVQLEVPKEIVEVKGTLKALSADSLTIATTGGDVVVQLNSTTIKPAGLKVGDKVEVRAVKQGSTLTALVVYVQIELQKELVELNGTVKAISADSLTITTTTGDVTVQLTSVTIKPAGLKVGDRVVVHAVKSGTTLSALLILSESTQVTVEGTVAVAGTLQITVRTERGSIVVKINSSTVITKKSGRISASDIKTGDAVRCRGSRIDDQSILAEQIEVRSDSGQK
jgi:uncharacterized membrane protein (UPF0127 family)